MYEFGQPADALVQIGDGAGKADPDVVPGDLPEGAPRRHRDSPLAQKLEREVARAEGGAGPGEAPRAGARWLGVRLAIERRRPERPSRRRTATSRPASMHRCPG